MAASAAKDDLRLLYTDVADAFDHVGPSLFSAFGERLVEFAGVRAGEAALDIGCGRGAILFAAARRAGPTGQVVGVDLTPAMVDRCRDDARQAGLENVAVARMDAERLAFGGGTFDVVMAGFVLFLCPDPARALAEAYRVLAPGGRIALSTFPPEQDRRWWWLPGTICNLRPESTVQLPCSSAQDVESALAAAGFDAVTVTTERVDLAYEDERQWLQTLHSHGQGRFLDDLDGAELERFQRTARRHLAAAREGDGRIHHRLAALLAQAVKPA